MNLIIKMEPVAKASPRINISNGKVHSYIPDRTQKALDYIRALLSEYIGNKFGAYIPVKLTVVFFRTKSKWARKSDIMPVRKPDIDNLLKLLLDGCNKLLVEDDAQITAINVKKRWSLRNYGYIKLNIEEDKIQCRGQS